MPFDSKDIFTLIAAVAVLGFIALRSCEAGARYVGKRAKIEWRSDQ